MDKEKKCCIFEERPLSEDCLRERLEKVEEIDFSYRHAHIVYKCKKCGAYVLYEYEEGSCFMPGENWDDADCYDRYFPVESVEQARELVNKYVFRVSGEDEIEFYEHYSDKEGPAEPPKKRRRCELKRKKS